MVKDIPTRSRLKTAAKMQTFEDAFSLLQEGPQCLDDTPIKEGSGVCPVCRMPFDKGKKRKLIDTCGHERCYSCLSKRDSCPVCALQAPAKKIQQSSSRSSLSPISGGNGRSKLITNGTISSYLRGGADPGLPPERPPSRSLLSRSVSPRRNTIVKLPPSSTLDLTHQHSLYYVPNTPLSSYARLGGKSPDGGSVAPSPTPPSKEQVAASEEIKSTGGTPWSSRRRGWGIRTPQLSPRLTRVIRGAASKPPKRPNTVNVDSPHQLADDGMDLRTLKQSNGATINEKVRVNSSNDLFMRLGLLLGDDASAASAPPPAKAPHASSHTSFSSLSASSESQQNGSNNTSPVSTLTGSSEAELRGRDPSIESMASLMSTSIAGPLSGPSSVASSEQRDGAVPRRHSVTTSQPGQVEELSLFNRRSNFVRRSARHVQMKGSMDPKVRFANYLSGQINLRPLFFEVPQQDEDPLFIGRSWLFKEIESVLNEDANKGVVISGNIGSGKTAAILQMVDYSCFGRKREEGIYQDLYARSTYGQVSLMPDGVRSLSSRVVAYHFCQADNAVTCHVPDFVHSIAAQLCQAPQLQAYRDLLLQEGIVQKILSLPSCISDPSVAFTKSVLDPLVQLRRIGKLNGEPMLIVIDGLCEAEYHRPDNGDTLASFLARHVSKFPSFLKVVVTVRTQLREITRALPFHWVSLDPDPSCSSITDSVVRDLSDFVTFRCSSSPSIRSNIAIPKEKIEGGNCLQRFTQHVVSSSRGSMLFLKLLLDLVERGNLIMKSGSFNVLPQSLNEIFLLLFNLRFSSVKSFEKVQPILNVCLVSLHPLTLAEIFHSVNSGLLYKFLSWEEFVSRFKILHSFLIKRIDETYMLYHPALREWLSRRAENESTKYLCDLRSGHSCIALRMSRLEWPLDSEGALELGHHILKAHVYKNIGRLLPVSSRDLQALWVAQSCQNVSEALTNIRHVYSPNTKVSRLLLLAGASPDYPTKLYSNSPILGVCALLGHTEMVGLLLEFGADVDAVNGEGQTPLNMASERGHGDIVRLLVAGGAAVDQADHGKEGPLAVAAKNGHLNVVAYLLSCDWLNSDVLCEQANQALVAAAGEGHVNVVEFLLDMSEVNIDCVDIVTGETALTNACLKGETEMVSILLVSGANVIKQNTYGQPPLACSVKQDHYEVTKLLLDEGVNPETPDSGGRTPFMVAAAEGHLGVMELLHSKGASVSRTDREGLTSLCWAALKGHIHAVQYLCDCGSDLNHADRSGRSPLDLSAYQGDPIVVQFLLDRGALVEHVDLNGMRPLDRAISARNAGAIQCFLRKGAKLGPATWAMAAGKPNIMIMLLNKLQEDGVTLCRKGRLREAAHRFTYALKKLPTHNVEGEKDAKQELEEHEVKFEQLRLHLIINLSRCKRKMKEYNDAIDLATKAIEINKDSYEAYYARARANREAKHLGAAVSDMNEAVRLAFSSPSTSKEIRRVLSKIKDEMLAELEYTQIQQDSVGKYEMKNLKKFTDYARSDMAHLKQMAASVDTLSDEHEYPMTSSILSESGYSSNI